ncbi:MAG: CotH kinase family protein, partial [Bacteroidales bacterium]|nr:CotH kinase family protein [Bacteroidales bacterium]
LLSAMVHAYYDDGITAYINGYEVLRENIIHNGIKPHHNTSAFRAHPSDIDNGMPPEGFMIPKKYFKNILKNGRNVFAIENHNFWSNNPQVIKPWLSFSSIDETYQFDTIPAFLETHNNSIHCNFKINGQGEKIYLTDSLGRILQKFNTPALSSNISIGIHIDHPDSLVYYLEPSPQENNNTIAKANVISDSIILQYISGYYKDSINIEVKNEQPLLTIRYTTDGSLPRDTAAIYDTAFYVDNTSVLRFRYFSDSLIAGPISNYTYLINDSSSLEYFSIITDPHNLWDNDYGIYVFGDHYAPEAPYFEANFWQKWERDVHLQHFSSKGDLFWQQDAGIKIHGNWTRMLDQKSFGFYAKSEYSDSKFEHQLFPNQAYHRSYKRFLLRNAGNDNRWAFLRDLLIHMRMKDEDIDIQMGKTVSSYLNGEYWGIYHLREKIDRFYIEEHWG